MKRMPVVFIGHGSPMNAIEENQFTSQWEALGTRIPRPQAILAISAHWFTPGSRVTGGDAPETIYDMYGFPEELYEIAYRAPGSPQVAQRIKDLLGEQLQIDNSWGFDHGTWSVLHRMYPQAEIPVLQLSVDSKASFADQYAIGQKLRGLREQGVLILGSGNVVHNLARISWNMEGGYPWAEDFDNYIKEKILNGSHQDVIHLEKAGTSARLAFTVSDHFAPLLYVLGAADEEDRVAVFNAACILGSLSMTSYLLG